MFCQHALQGLVRRSDLSVSAFAVTWRGRGLLRDYAPPGVRVLDRPMPARPLHMAWSHGRIPPIEWWIGNVDVVHGTRFVVPPTRAAARVVTVHDLWAVRFPELCDDYSRNFPRFVRRAVADGVWVHTPSQHVAAEVIELLGAPPDRVRAVHHGIPDLEPAREGVLTPEVLGSPYVLALGTVEPRKGLVELVQAFDTVAGEVPEVRLVVAGAQGWRMEAFESAIAASHHRGRIVRLGYLDEARRGALLRGATVYAYPSLYEGFGFPPLEAMLAGVPVLTTTGGALPEVVGDAAVSVEPGDVDALAGGLHALLTDDGARRTLIDRGKLRASQFSWEATAEGLARLYRDACDDHP
jgi:glycosyltransferase involved in cell wall biosynthesis